MARETTTCAFKISSATLDAKAIEARIGIKPDASWKAGAPRGAFGAIEKLHGFVLESTLGPSTNLEEHVKEMLKRLIPSAQKIGSMVNEAQMEFTCSLQRLKGPMLHFDRDTVRWLAVMGSRLDIDTMIVADPPPKPAGGAAAGTPGKP